MEKETEKRDEKQQANATAKGEKQIDQEVPEELGLFIILTKPFDDEEKNRSFWLDQLPE